MIVIIIIIIWIQGKNYDFVVMFYSHRINDEKQCNLTVMLYENIFKILRGWFLTTKLLLWTPSNYHFLSPFKSTVIIFCQVCYIKYVI